MVPIHDTDVAEERWSQSSWRTFELWERLEVQFKKTRRNWIFLTIFVFLGLSSIPVVMDRMPKWRSLKASRTLAQELNRLKRDAATDHYSYRIRFTKAEGLKFEVETLKSCEESKGTFAREGSLLPDSIAYEYSLLGFEKGEQYGIPGLVKELCYDFQKGGVYTQHASDGRELVAFGIMPVKDMTPTAPTLGEARMDRLSLTLVDGESAEISFH